MHRGGLSAAHQGNSDQERMKFNDKHNQKKKPYSEVSYCMDVDTVQDLMTGFAPTSDTKQMTKWHLNGPEVFDLLPESMRMLHPQIDWHSAREISSTPLHSPLPHLLHRAISHHSARPHCRRQV